MTQPVFNRRKLFSATLAAAGLEVISQSALASPSSPEKPQTARTFSPPSSISPAAQEYLRKGAAAPPPSPVPATTDLQGWRAYVDRGNMTMPLDLIAKIPGFTEEKRVLGDATYYVVTPIKLREADRQKAHFHIHGGGWVLFGGAYTAAFAKIAAMQFNCITYAVDYRMPPDHPFPAGLEDCLTVYQEVIKAHGPKNVLVSGGSAGGNLAAALMLKLSALGLASPCALYLDSPVTDLTNSGDSWRVLEGLDPVLRDVDGVGSAPLYLNGRDPREPLLSPLFGDLSGFPPTHLHSGTRDRLLSDTVRFHAALRAAGIVADLYISEAMPHAGFGGTTVEERVVLADTRRWLQSHWPSS